MAVTLDWVRPDSIQAVVAATGSLSMLVYVIAVVIAEFIWMPRMWALLAGGILFGPWVGGLLSLVGDTISAAICYGFARGAGRKWVAAKVQRRPRTKRIVQLLAERRGGTTVAILRVVPVAHYTLVSYTAGLSGVRPAPFFVGNTVGLLPGAVLYPFVGAAALRPTSPEFLISAAVLLGAFVASFIVAPRILRRRPDAGLGDTSCLEQRGNSR